MSTTYSNNFLALRSYKQHWQKRQCLGRTELTLRISGLGDICVSWSFDSRILKPLGQVPQVTNAVRNTESNRFLVLLFFSCCGFCVCVALCCFMLLLLLSCCFLDDFSLLSYYHVLDFVKTKSCNWDAASARTRATSHLSPQRAGWLKGTETYWDYCPWFKPRSDHSTWSIEYFIVRYF